MRGVMALAAAFIAAAALSGSPVFAQQAKFLKKHGAWSSYVSSGTAKKTCFAVAQPHEQTPKGVKRDPAYFYISHYAADKTRNEISIKMGYPLKSGVPAEIAIGEKKFTLFTKGEGAFVEKKATENAIVAAMRAGNTLTVQGRSSRGTLTTDKYSLNGISAALDNIARECP